MHYRMDASLHEPRETKLGRGHERKHERGFAESDETSKTYLRPLSHVWIIHRGMA